MNTILSSLNKLQSDASAELLKLIREEKSSLFVFDRQNDLVRKLNDIGITDYCATKVVFPRDELFRLAESANFSEKQWAHFYTANLILERLHLEARQFIKDDQDTGNVDEGSEDDLNDDDEGANAATVRVMAEYLIEKYTFKKAFVSGYQKLLKKYVAARRTHHATINTSKSAIERWERTRGALRTLFSLLGIEAWFAVIEELTKRSPTFDYFMKTIGTILVPVLVSVWFIWVAAKFLANPISKIANWLAKELDIKPPVIEPDEAI